MVFVDGVRTAFGRAGPKGVFWKTRADDMAVKVVRELVRRNPEVPLERIGDVVFAATAQVGDQGLTLGRDVALLAGIPQTVPGFALDRSGDILTNAHVVEGASSKDVTVRFGKQAPVDAIDAGGRRVRGAPGPCCFRGRIPAYGNQRSKWDTGCEATARRDRSPA